LKGQALGFRIYVIVRLCRWKDAREEREGRRFFFGSTEGAPERPRDPGEQRARLRINSLEGKEYGFSSGGKPLERWVKAERFS
jgi:hypothetical protein